MSKLTLPVFVPPLPSPSPGTPARLTAQGTEVAQTADGATFAELLENAAGRAVVPTEATLPRSLPSHPIPTPSFPLMGEESEGKGGEKLEAQPAPANPRRASAPGALTPTEAVVLAAPLPLPLSIPPVPPAAPSGDTAPQKEEASAPPQGVPTIGDPLLPPVQRKEGQVTLPAAPAPASPIPTGLPVPGFNPVEPGEISALLSPSPLSPPSTGGSFPLEGEVGGGGSPTWEPHIEGPAGHERPIAAEAPLSAVLRSPFAPRPPLEAAFTTEAIEPAIVQITVAAGSPGAPEPATDAILSQDSASGVEQALSNVTLSASEGEGVSQGSDRSPVAFVPKLEPAPNPVTPYPAAGSPGDEAATPDPIGGAERGPIIKGDGPLSSDPPSDLAGASDPLSGSVAPVEMGIAHSIPLPQSSPVREESVGAGLRSAPTGWEPGSESSSSVIHRPPSAGDGVWRGSAPDGPTPPPLSEPPRMPPGEIPPVSKTHPPTPEPLPQPMGSVEPPAVISEPLTAAAPLLSLPPQPPLLEGRQTTGDGDDPAPDPWPLGPGLQPKPEQHHPSGPLPPERGPAPQGEAQQVPARYHPSGPLPPERDPAAEEPPSPSVPAASDDIPALHSGQALIASEGTGTAGRSGAMLFEPPDATHELRFVSQVASHLERQVRSGVSRAALRLYPEALGRVDVHLRLDSSGLYLRLSTETLEAGALFERHLDQLRDALVARGVNVQELNVSVSTGFQMSAHTHSGRQAPPGAETLPPPVPPARHSPAEMASSAPPAPSGEGAQERPLVDYRV